MNCELNNAEIYLQSAAQLTKKSEEQSVSMRNPVTRNYFLSVTRFKYFTFYTKHVLHFKYHLNSKPIINHKLSEQGCVLKLTLVFNIAPLQKKNRICKLVLFYSKRVAYGRETTVQGEGEDPKDDKPNHRLVVHDLMALWDIANRNAVMTLFDSYMKAEQLKYNLSADALKMFKVDTGATPQVSKRIH